MKLATPSNCLVLSTADCFARWQNRPEVKTVATGIVPLDKALGGGLRCGVVSTLLGYAGSNKSELCRQIGQHAAKNGAAVIHVDVELGPDELFQRQLAQATHIPASLLDGRNLTKGQHQKIESVQNELLSNNNQRLIHPLDPLPVGVLGTTVTETAAVLGRSQTLVILDSLQRLADGVQANDPRAQVTYFLRWLERFAHRTGFAVLITSEQKRNAEGIEPSAEEMLTSGAEARAIEFVSHLAIGLIPAEPPTKMEARSATDEQDHRRKLLICKNRSGAKGYVPAVLNFKAPYWDLVVADQKKHLNPLQVEKCRAKLIAGVCYTGDELRKLWGINSNMAREIRNELIEKKMIEVDGEHFVFVDAAKSA